MNILQAEKRLNVLGKKALQNAWSETLMKVKAIFWYIFPYFEFDLK